ncbi:MAG: glycine oxidase ThiO [Pseudanabaenaceae cyanobacterium]|jgi:glycine oxidase ThiO
MDVCIIGGGVIGLALAVDLAQRGAAVTILERGQCGRGATWAAAGMLAPEAEGLTGDLLSLGVRSRELYASWVSNLMKLTGMSCGYWCCGIIAPLDPNKVNQHPELRQHPSYIDRNAIERKQPHLAPQVTEALWLPEDGQVNNRDLGKMLYTAARMLGVKICEGTAVHSLVKDSNDQQITHLETSAGKIVADRYILATGAWTKDLLPLPIRPIKGQMAAIFDPQRSLQRVIFAPNIYIVPRQDGLVVLGATVEDVGFLPANTAKGVNQLLANAIATYPAIAEMELVETWWGFRPHAPAEMPLLGPHPDYQNLILATGHYRNGILLAPVTANLLGEYISTGQVAPLLTKFLPRQS